MANIQQSLKKLLENIADENNYENSDIEIKPFTTGGANYSSAIFYATISVPDKDDLNLFAKVAAVGEEYREKSSSNQMFTAEQMFYNDLACTWKQIEEKNKVPKKYSFPSPKFYGSRLNSGEETIVLEDLVKQGYGMYSRFVSVDWEYASKSIEELAKFHALSFIFEKEEPEKYRSICKKLVYDPPISEEYRQAWKEMTTTALQALSEENRAKVERYLESNDSLENYKKYYSQRGRPIIVHGDYRPSNLMSKKVCDTYKIIPVDYQTIRTGCPASDLVYFVALGSDENFRAQYFEQLIDHYYKELTLALRRFHMEISEVYSREEFNHDLKEMLPYTILVALMVLQLVTVEVDNAPQPGCELDAFNVKTNDLYAERFTGLINDCVRWGILS